MLNKSAQAAGDVQFFFVSVSCKTKTSSSGKDNPHLRYIQRGGQRQRGGRPSCGVPLTRRSTSGRTRMVGRVFTCMFGAQLRGIASLPARPPAAPVPLFSRVRHHSAGVSSNLIQEALQGVDFFFFFLVWWGAENYPQVPGPGTSQT